MRQADPGFPYTGHGAIDKLLRACLALAVAVTFASVAFLAIVHLGDRYNVNHVSGTWMALAWDLTHGVLYRPFFENGYYGLSGYMPLQFTVNAGAALITGEYLVSAKLVAYVSGLSVLALSYIALRAVGCPRLTALGLIAALVATDAGLLAVTGIHGDALPLALQLGALVLIMRSTSRRSVVVAALLCTLAVLAKFTAIWALVAIVAWLAVKKRAELVAFAGTFVASTVASLVIFEIASDGRMSKNLAEIVAPGGSASQGSPVAGVSTFFELVVEHAGAIWILLPFAALALLQAAGRRSFTLPQLALLLALPITVVVLGNPGADFNHLVDVGALTVVVVGEQLASTARDTERPTMLPALVSIALILGIAQSYRISLKPDVAHAAKVKMGREQSAYSNKPLTPLLDKRLLVLSEDPAIPILRNEKPILSDGLGLLRLSDRHADLLHNLIARLDARAFDRIVLTHPIEDDIWYRERSLGRDVQMAIERNYVLLDKLPVNLHDEYWIYQPKASSPIQS